MHRRKLLKKALAAFLAVNLIVTSSSMAFAGNNDNNSADVNYENGMGVSIGRLREDSMFDYKFIGLSHNTVRGAAGGAVLCAEALTAKGYIEKK
jgi:aspartate-semialdehyde dehydrogenase